MGSVLHLILRAGWYEDLETNSIYLTNKWNEISQIIKKEEEKDNFLLY